MIAVGADLVETDADGPPMAESTSVFPEGHFGGWLTALVRSNSRELEWPSSDQIAKGLVSQYSRLGN